MLIQNYQYDICENHINISLDKILSIQSTNNIISLNKNNNQIEYNLEHLKQLIKIFYFQGHLYKAINSPYTFSG